MRDSCNFSSLLVSVLNSLRLMITFHIFGFHQVTFPFCTIANTPRLPEHCIEYVRVMQWQQDKPFGGKFGASSVISKSVF